MILALASTMRSSVIIFLPNARMSHDEERVNGGGVQDEYGRAPRHWLNPLVGSPIKYLPASTWLSKHFPAPLNRLLGEGVQIKSLNLPASGTRILVGTFAHDNYVKKVSAPAAVNHHVDRELELQKPVRLNTRAHELRIINQPGALLRLGQFLPMRKLVQKVKCDMNFKKIPAAGCDC